MLPTPHPRPPHVEPVRDSEGEEEGNGGRSSKRPKPAHPHKCPACSGRPYPPGHPRTGPCLLSDADRPAASSCAPHRPHLQGTPAPLAKSLRESSIPLGQQHFYLHGSRSATSVSAEPRRTRPLPCGAPRSRHPTSKPGPRAPSGGPSTSPLALPSAPGRRSTPVPHPQLPQRLAPGRPSTPLPRPRLPQLQEVRARATRPQSLPSGAERGRGLTGRGPRCQQAPRVRPRHPHIPQSPNRRGASLTWAAARLPTLGAPRSYRNCVSKPRLRLRPRLPPSLRPRSPGPALTQPRPLLPPAPNASPPSLRCALPIGC